MHPFLEEIIGVIVAFALHILGKGHADRAGLRRVGQHTHGLHQSRHQLLGAGDPIPEFTHRAERIVGGDAGAIALLQLLQHRVRLADGEGIAGQQQQGDAVDGGASSSGDHIGGTGADGRGTGDDLASVILPGKTGSHMGHALLVATLVNLQAAGIFFQRLAQAHHDAVAENGEHAIDKLGLHPVQLDILIVQEFYNGLAHSHHTHCCSSRSQQTLSPYFSLLARIKAWISSAWGISSEQE